MRFLLPLLLTSLAVAQTAPPAPNPTGSTLAKIKAARTLACGVNSEEAEYTNSDAHGNHTLLDVDLCKALAVAVLGPHAKTQIVPYRDEEDALRDLAAGTIDVLATGSADFQINAQRGFSFSQPVFYDYQAFLVNKASNIHATADLAGKKVCFLLGGEEEAAIQTYMARKNMKWLPAPFSEEGEMEAALITHNCDAISADVTQLAYERIAFRNMASSFEIVPEVVAKDPLAMIYRSGDIQWANVVDWLVRALILAEESGVTQANLPEMKKSVDSTLARLLGTQHGYGQYLGLDDAWASNAIEAVGNYGELFERSVGAKSLMKLPRGANALWTSGGLMYADPIR